MSTKGIAGSIRVNSVGRSGLSAMQKHGFRLDKTGEKRAVYPERKPLWYRPYGSHLNLLQSYDAHFEGAIQSKRAGHLARHAFVQFPTNIEMSEDVEKMLIREAADFINKTHGGNAVFEARLDRDEKGRHGVDVFFAPRYTKKTAKGEQDWISLTKFGKAMACDRYGQRHLEIKNPKTKKWEKQFDENGEPIMVWNDSKYWQGKALQDEWFEHLRDIVGLDFVVRGKPKPGREADRLEPEEYGVMQDRATRVRLQAENDVLTASLSDLTATIENIDRQISDQDAKKQKNEGYLEKQQAKLADLATKVDANQAAFDKAEKRIADYARRVETAKIEVDRLEKLREAAQSAYEADLERGREEGRAEGRKAIRDAREAAQALAGGEFKLSDIDPVAAKVRELAISAATTAKHELENMHRRSAYAERQTDEWRVPLRRYRERLEAYEWQNIEEKIRNADVQGKEALQELADTKTGSLVDRVLAMVRGLAQYWNGLAQAFQDSFPKAMPTETLAKGILDEVVPRPVIEYGYLQPFVREAQQELKTLDLAEKLADLSGPSGP